VTDNGSSSSTSLNGGGLFINGKHLVTVENTRISGNSANKGGGVFCSSGTSPLFRNTLFLSNTAKSAGGVYCDTASTPSLVNSTFSRNSYTSAASSASGLYGVSASPIVRNCVFWNDLPLEIRGVSTTKDLVQYCDVQGGFPGTGNIDTDPLFVDPENGDFHLQEDSPCIGKGIGPGLNSLVPLFDFEGDPRSGQECDMGADEYNGPTLVIDWFNY
jgi:hypothetical protein